MNKRAAFTLLGVIAFFSLSTNARSDWAAVGAAYECTKAKFAIYPVVVENGYEVIPRPYGTESMEVGFNNLSCVVSGKVIVAKVVLTSPGHNGICGDPGTISIDKLQVGETKVFTTSEQMLHCSGQRSIVSVEFVNTSRGVRGKICRGSWNLGGDFENVRCEKRLYGKHVKVTNSSKAP